MAFSDNLPPGAMPWHRAGMFAAIALAASALSPMLANRTPVSWVHLRYSPAPRLLALLNLVLAYTATALAGTILFGVGPETAAVCDGGITSGLALYAASRVCSFAFLAERANIVWSVPGARRWRNGWYWISSLLLAGLAAVSAILVAKRDTRIREGDAFCVVELPTLWALIVLCASFGFATFLLLLFIVPLFRPSTPPKKRTIASSGIISTLAVLLLTGAACGTLFGLGGKEVAYLFFLMGIVEAGGCATVLYWSTRHSSMEDPLDTPHNTGYDKRLSSGTVAYGRPSMHVSSTDLRRPSTASALNLNAAAFPAKSDLRRPSAVALAFAQLDATLNEKAMPPPPPVPPMPSMQRRPSAATLAFAQLDASLAARKAEQDAQEARAAWPPVISLPATSAVTSTEPPSPTKSRNESRRPSAASLAFAQLDASIAEQKKDQEAEEARAAWPVSFGQPPAQQSTAKQDRQRSRSQTPPPPKSKNDSRRPSAAALAFALLDATAAAQREEEAKKEADQAVASWPPTAWAQPFATAAPSHVSPQPTPPPTQTLSRRPSASSLAFAMLDASAAARREEEEKQAAAMALAALPPPMQVPAPKTTRNFSRPTSSPASPQPFAGYAPLPLASAPAPAPPRKHSRHRSAAREERSFGTVSREFESEEEAEFTVEIARRESRNRRDERPFSSLQERER